MTDGPTYEEARENFKQALDDFRCDWDEGYAKLLKYLKIQVEALRCRKTQ